MARYVISVLLFRFLLPAALTVCAIFRPCGLSAIYLLITFYMPFVPVPTKETMNGHSGIFLKILLAISVLTFTSQVVFHICLICIPSDANFLQLGSTAEKIAQTVGYIRLKNISIVDGVIWISPEIIMLITSICVFVAIKKITNHQQDADTLEGGISLRNNAKEKQNMSRLVTFGRYFVLILLCTAGVLHPSIPSGIYYLVFLSSATWWACYKQLNRAFAVILYFLAPIIFVNLWVQYAYQFPWSQELVERDNPYIRYFGITALMVWNNTNSTVGPRHYTWNTDEEWPFYIQPATVYILYYFMMLEAKELFKPEDLNFEDLNNSQQPGETTPLLRGVSPASKRSSGRKQDSTASGTVTGEDIPLDELGAVGEEEYEPTLFDNILYALETVLQLIVRSSYIGTNIIMMAWSITYLSWMTFVLLIWANLIWLVPKQRKSMLATSPFLVFYAWFLLLSGYIYSLNLTEEELPSKLNNIDLAEIGFVKVRNYPCGPLLVKSLFTIMFCVTLRQFMQERLETKQTSALADMAAPLQVTVGTATVSGANKEQEYTGSQVMEKIGKYVKAVLTKYWILVVAITLFAVAITGERMTGFRILYMALFLIFVITFQVSFRAWRRMMFGFWLTIIIYSMMILIATYTYQFKEFPKYWTEYLHVPKQIQADIGLEQFETKQLFVRLVTPTFFVIITVIQLHYFHNDFMELSDPMHTTSPMDNRAADNFDLEQSSMQGGAEIDNSAKSDMPSTEVQFNIYALQGMTKEKFYAIVKNVAHQFEDFKNLVYLFVELHMMKIVLYCAMLMCVFDKCAIYFIIVVLISLAVIVGRPLQNFAIYASSFLVSLMLLARMIFQVKYITPEKWSVTCNNTVRNDTNYSIQNNAPWFGFQKEAEAGQNLPILVQWNIIYIIVVTFYSIVMTRQHNYRLKRGLPTTRPFFMFPDISRKDADKSIMHCIKYLFNFGFYKFGFEITLMMLVALIDLRFDVYSFFHALCLFGFCFMSRSTLSKIWVFYMIFIAISIPVQYFMVVGLPPTLCQEFPWDGTDYMWEGLQDWAYLLDNFHPLDARKLLCDFLLLIFVTRQWVVFRIEKRYAGKRYAGGSNESIIHHFDETNFKNPVDDFITYVWSYLCIIKKLVLQSFLWITLAIIFLAGTERVNIYSLGYLIAVFFFLWHGSDLYLRPIPKILRWWQWLIGYAAGVLLLKSIFQLVGCVFSSFIPQGFCWMVQMLSIMCVRKFKFSGKIIDYNFPDSDQCAVETGLVGMKWDAICLIFLIMQRRIFNSYYFFHIIDDVKADTILASRGAELLEERRQKTMKEQVEEEKNILEKIKMKMDRIKRNQQKIQDSIYKGRPKYRVKPPAHYKQAIRSGDYYMFDELEDEDIDLLPEEKAPEEEKLEMLLKPGIGQLLNTVIKEDVDTAIRNQGLRRQLSMPVPKQSRPVRSQLSGYSAPPTIEEPRSVRIAELPEEDEPQPSTSKDEDDMSEPSEHKESIGTKILRVLLFLWAFIESAMVSLTNLLNRYSRNYRYVLKILSKEKKILKERTNYKQGLRTGATQVWQPAASYHSLLQQSVKSSKSSPRTSEYGEEMSSYDQPTSFRLMLAIWYIVMSRSEFLCYFVIFLNQIKTATFLTLPLPIMVFFWGSLTIPRPSKTFWITIIAYTEVIVLLKCIFQFDIMPGNKGREKTQFEWSNSERNVLFPTRLFGLYRQENYALWDLLVLLVVFFHRILLKSMGIWSSSTPTTAALLDDGEYRLEEHQLVPVSEGSPPKKDKKKASPGSSRSTSLDETLVIKSRPLMPMDFFVNALKMTISQYAKSLKVFNQQLLDPTSRVAADVYFLMFFCDFFNFFVLLFGYSSFGSQQDGGVQAYLEDNRVPPLFLFMLLFQFMLIIIDRGIYLRKNILAKIVFQYVQIILLHLWLFIVFPVITGSYCKTVIPPQIYYMVKCFYLLLSAYQIRCGYPSRILGNFLCKGYGYVNMWLFRGFMIVPFLFELRTCMDWMWTETSMTIFDWIKMEDIFQHIFLLKCSRNIEDEYPQPRGEKKKPFTKYLMGGAVLAVIIAIIWFPLVFFSLGNTVGQPNIPSEVNLEIRLGTYEPIYKMTAQSNSIYQFDGTNLNELNSAYNGHKLSETFLYNYEGSDIAAVKLSTDSANIWSISPPDREKMLLEVNSTKPLSVSLKYEVLHKTMADQATNDISNEITITLEPSTNASRNPVREDLYNMLKGENATALLQYIFPKFLKVTNKGTATPVSDLMLEKPDIRAKTFRNITISLQSITEGNQVKEWWTVKEICGDTNYKTFLMQIPYEDCTNSLVLYTFNDKIFPKFLDFLTGGGIIGLYTTLVLLASRILRGFFADQCSKIMFDDLPFVDRVLQLCFDIYLVREASEFALEEDLFAKLVFLFRSPETLIKWTRPKEEVDEDDDDPEAVRE